MNENNEWEDLVDRHLHGELNETEQERLAELIDSDPSLRKDFVEQVQWNTELSKLLRVDGIQRSQSVPMLSSQAGNDATNGTRLLRILLAVAAVAILVLSWMLLDEKTVTDIDVAETTTPAQAVSIARITGLSGALIWTGDRGEVVRDIQVGSELAGGTIEGLAPDSWFELEFHDRSKVMISGTSMLTFADAGQKRLRLREGRLSADVVPQPAGKPMLIQTRTALLNVIGTQFEVEAGLTSTTLNVSEGKVRLRRLSDGSEVDVPAQHLVFADDEQVLTPLRVPDSVEHWKTQFNLGRDYYGKWLPANGDRPASLKAIPFVPPNAPQVTLQLAGLSVDRSNSSPVVVRPGSRFIVRGIVKSDTRIFFGIRVSHPNGEFAGMFRGDLADRQPLVARDEAGEFEEVYDLKSFTVDPAVEDKRDELAKQPDDLVLDGVWAFTHSDGPSGLVLTEVELVPPTN
ncbi:MAG: FecR family protein [Pirellulaceae bacterium]